MASESSSKSAKASGKGRADGMLAFASDASTFLSRHAQKRKIVMTT